MATNQALKFLAISVLSAQLSGCATLSGLWPFGGDEPSAETAEQNAESEGEEGASKTQNVADEANTKLIEDLKAQNEKSKLHIAKLELEVQSLKEGVASLKRNVQVLNRGARSGVYYEDPNVDGTQTNLGFDELGSETGKTSESTASVLDVPTAKIDLHGIENRVTFEEAKPVETDDVSVTGKMLAEAQLKMSKGQYGEAVVVLKELQTRFPDAQDGGAATLLQAEAWVQLKSYENVMPLLRSFYLKYPHSADLLRAKNIEARTYEGLGSKEKAANLYREIIAAGPTTAFAKDARGALQKLRDER